MPDPRIRVASAKARKLVRLMGNRAYWPALRRGVAASVEHTGIPFGRDFATVLDVGASRGQFALFSRENFPGAEIICFEPQSDAADDLSRVIGGQVELFRTALGPEPGKASMNISAQDDSSSLLDIGERQVAEFPGTQAKHSIEVPVSTLDDSLTKPLGRPCLLKIDVQGYELQVLQGGARVLGEIDVALIECSFVELYEGQAMAEEIVLFMHDSGFRLAGVHGISYSADGSAIQGDFLFRRANKEVAS